MPKLVKRLNAQELGHRKGVPGQAGRYIYISKGMIAAFPQLASCFPSRNASAHLNVLLLPNRVPSACDYKYYGEGTRDEFRIYLKTIDPGHTFQPGDIVIIEPVTAGLNLEYLPQGAPAHSHWDNHLTTSNVKFDII